MSISTTVSNPATLPERRQLTAPPGVSQPTPESTTSPVVGWLSLLAGTALLILGQHGNPDIGIAGWLYAIFLLRFTRSVRWLPGILVIAAAHALAGAAWVISIRLPTDGIPWPAIIGAAGLNLVLAVPFLIDRLIAVPLRLRHPLLASLVFPTALVGAELLMLTVSPYGKVFGSLAAGQHGNLPLLQLASVTGAYGISFLMAWFGSAGCELWQRPHRLLPIGIVAGVISIVLAAGAARLALDDTSAAPAGADQNRSVRIAGITPARSLDDVSDRLPDGAEAAKHPRLVSRTMAPVTENLLQRTRQQAVAGAKIIVWSEASTLVHEDRLADLVQSVSTVARQQHVYVDVAAGVFTRQAPHARNISVLIGPDGRQLFSYDKMHPVPGMEQTKPGTKLPPVADTPVGRLAGMICYDLDFSDTASTDADIVLLPSADWPGFDRLHTQKAQLWAVEQGYAVFRQDAYGTAGAFDAYGRPLAAVDYDTTGEQTMIAQVPTSGTGSVYARIGDQFAYLCLAGLVVLTITSVVVRRRAVRTNAATIGG